MTNGRAKMAKCRDFFVLPRCCPEAQADGVPCPTLGRSCETCERAMAAEAETPEPVIRPIGSD